MKRRLIAGFAGLLMAMTALAARAQVQTESGVARISLIHGDVSTRRGDSGDWAAAALNAPLVNNDKISTGDKSRAEIQLDYANILRLADRSEANIAGLTRTEIQVQVSRGLANYTVFRNSEANIEIDTPNASIHPSSREGSYRILVAGDDETEIMVRKGDADVATPQGRTRVEKGQLIRIRGTGSDTQYQVADAPGRDDWDRWNGDRDNTIRNAQAWKNTNQYYVGSEDLDAYGRWTTVPDYGSVWVPYAESGWAPYRSGRWVWEPYWGWTWVSYDPWGWAPYHYGRWFVYGGSWVWWPGPVYSYGYGYGHHYRPIWAPAYVSFFGFGHGWGVGFGWGSVGWLPIGPCDSFYPWYGRYRSHYNVVNVTNITNITNVYNIHKGVVPPLGRGTRFSNLRMVDNDERVRKAVSVVPANDFGRGRVNATPIDREGFRKGQMVAGNLPIVPGRESLRANDAGAAPSTIMHRGTPERFFGKSAPVTAKPFDREAADIRSSIERSGKFTPIERGNTGQNPRTVPGTQITANPVENRNTPGGGNRGQSGTRNENWRKFGGPENSRNVNAGSEGAKPANRGLENRNAPNSGNREQWRRFDDNAGAGNRGGNRESSSPTVTIQDRNGERPARIREDNGEWRRSPSNSQSSSGDSGGRPADNRRRDSSSNSGSESWRHFPSESRSAEPMNRPEGGVRNSGPSRGPEADIRREPEYRRPVERAPERQMSRPPLDMRQPIVTPRSSGPAPSEHRGGGGGNSGGGSHSAPSQGPRSGGSGGGQNHRR